MWNDVLKIWAGNKKESLNKKIAQHLLDLDNKIFSTNISKEAKKLNVSPSTITKFLNKCGYSGWKMYASIALLNVNRKAGAINDKILGQKIELGIWIDQIFSKEIKSIAKKIIKSSKLSIVAHGPNKGLFAIFERSLRILGVNIEIIDTSEQYISYSKSYSSVTIITSFSGNSKHLQIPIKKFKKNSSIGFKIFISPSNHFIKEADININLINSNINLSHLENIVPIIKISFVQHILDKIIDEILKIKKYKLYDDFNKQGLLEKIETQK